MTQNDLRVNHRYRDVRKLPPLIANAMRQLTRDAEMAVKASGVEFPKSSKVRLKVSIWFTFDSMRPDVDGPSKRTLDAIAAGCGFNDGRVDELNLYRTEVGTPGIVAVVETLGEVEGDEVEALTDDPWAMTVGEPFAMIRS